MRRLRKRAPQPSWTRRVSRRTGPAGKDRRSGSREKDGSPNATYRRDVSHCSSEFSHGRSSATLSMEWCIILALSEGCGIRKKHGRFRQCLECSRRQQLGSLFFSAPDWHRQWHRLLGLKQKLPEWHWPPRLAQSIQEENGTRSSAVRSYSIFSRPLSMAKRTRSARLLRPSLPVMLVRCVSTVRSEMCSFSATSALVWP